MRFSLLALLALGLLAGAPLASQAQDRPRFGVGLQVTGSTVDNNVGPGLRFRTSVPINQDLSLGLGAALTGYVFEGRDDASYAFDPQTSLIVTLPGSSTQRTYVLGGVGAFVPFGDTDAASGPTLHLGVGRVWLLNESSFFAEFDPALFVGAEETQVIFPVRIGVIF
ncbi:MAG: hypothetical protein ABEL97_00750 [Salinibacter sp.]